LETTYNENQTFLESKEYANVLAEQKSLNEKVANLLGMQIEAEAFNASIPLKYRVTEELLEMILSTIPRNVAFENYTISPSGIAIAAVATDYSYMAELEYNLRSLNIFENIFIRVIAKDDEKGFLFNVELAFGGENHDQ
jgi:hypothetical protein